MSNVGLKRLGTPLVIPAVLIAALLGTAVQISRLSAQESSYQQLLQPVLTTSETVIGEAITYPDGPAQVTSAVVTVPPGGETGWHTHPVPLFGYILEGELLVDYGPHGTRTYRSGDGLMDAMQGAHNGRNPGSVPVRILAVYMGAAGVANAQPAAAPASPDAAGPTPDKH